MHHPVLRALGMIALLGLLGLLPIAARPQDMDVEAMMKWSSADLVRSRRPGALDDLLPFCGGEIYDLAIDAEHLGVRTTCDHARQGKQREGWMPH